MSGQLVEDTTKLSVMHKLCKCRASVSFFFSHPFSRLWYAQSPPLSPLFSLCLSNACRDFNVSSQPLPDRKKVDRDDK